MLFFGNKKECKLTPTQELLLALLRAQLWLKPVDDIVLPSSMEEWDDLLNLGYKQTVICFIAAACLRHKDVDSIPLDIKDELDAVLEENKRIHEHHNKILIELITKFEEQGLHPILLKGQGIAHFYDCVYKSFESPEKESGNSDFLHSTPFTLHSQNSLLRQCGDIDIYFRSDEYEVAKSYILTIEDCITVRQNEKYHHFESCYGGITVEIHKHTSWIPNPFANIRLQLFAEKEMKHPDTVQIDCKDINIPSPIYNIVSVFAHMWHHFEDRGVSLRQMCDVVILIQYYCREYSKPKLQKQQLEYIFDTISHLKFWKISECAFVKYLGLSKEVLDNCDKRYEYRADLMLRIVLVDGAFNYTKDCKNETMSGVKKRITNHLKGHREFMKVKPVVGNSIYWNYAAFKKFLPLKILNIILEFCKYK